MATERQETVKEGFNELKRLIQRAGEGSQEARVQSAADAEDDLLRAGGEMAGELPEPLFGADGDGDGELMPAQLFHVIGIEGP